MDMPEEYVSFRHSNPVATEYYYGYLYNRIYPRLDLNPNDIVVDYGCGTGELTTKYLAPNVKSVYGIDISPDMMEAAKSNNPAENVEYILGDFDKLKQVLLEDGIFRVDKLTAIFVINFFEDYSEFLNNAFKFLKPEGLLGLVIPFFQEQGIVAKLFEDAKWKKYLDDGPPIIKQASWMFDYENLEVTDFREPLEAIGFKVVDYTLRAVRVPFENLRQLCETLTLWDPLFALIPAEEKSSFIKEFEEYATANIEHYSIQIDPETEAASMLFNATTIIASKIE